MKTQNVNISLIEVFDMARKEVMSIFLNASKVEIDEHSLNMGLYFAKITNKRVFTMLNWLKNKIHYITACTRF
ncbi:MAG: T9SS type A sorting domain-containing protein [Chitinophagales bacterium]